MKPLVAQVGPAFTFAAARPGDNGPGRPFLRGVMAGPEGGRVVDVDVRCAEGDDRYGAAVAGEVALRSRCRHPSVPPMRAAGRGRLAGDDAFVCIQDAALGVTLSELEERRRQSEGTLATSIALQIVSDLAWTFAHVAGVGGFGRAHLEAMGSAFVVGWDGRLRARMLLDLVPDRRDTLIGPGLLRGRIWPMSPERVYGRALDARDDVYTVGIFAWRLLAGRSPFQGLASDFEMIRRIVETGPPPLQTARPDLPGAVCDVVTRATRRDPEERPRTQSELAALIDEVRAAVDPAGAGDVAGFMRALFPEQQREDAELVEEAAGLALPPDGQREQVLALHVLDLERAWAQLQADSAPLPAGGRLRPQRDPFAEGTRPDARIEGWGRDGRAMVLVGAGAHGKAFFVDRAPVTRREYARFLEETERPARPPDGAGDDAPVTRVSIEEARAFAQWAGKRLPTSAEWDAVVARDADESPAQRVLGQGVWEWTATGFPGVGVVVRGGRYRDRPSEQARPPNIAWEQAPAGDVGFRCAADADAAGIVKTVVE